MTGEVRPLRTYNKIRHYVQRCSGQILRDRAKLFGNGFSSGYSEDCEIENNTRVVDYSASR
ncbi:MAG: hypothetical protein LBB24_01595 [Rickettsiales bacterium]|nr:hypothetical protein [Rickettsiales bacterium]